MSGYRDEPAVTGGLGSGSATRDVKNLRNKPKITDLIREGRSKITDQSGKHEIEVDWELNEMAVRDHIFRLRIDDKEVYIDMEEWLFVQRIMFMKG